MLCTTPQASQGLFELPRSVDQSAVRDFLGQQPGVSAVHHLHIWSLGTGEVAMTAHLVRPGEGDNDVFLDKLNRALDQRFGINHPTVQIERGAACDHDHHDRAPRH